MEMREVFVEKLAEAMERDDKIVVIDADLAKSTKTWGLRKTFPDRALDVGIAEQNMASIAAGLSAYGFNPFITSFAPFVTRRFWTRSQYRAYIQSKTSKSSEPTPVSAPRLTAERIWVWKISARSEVFPIF